MELPNYGSYFVRVLHVWFFLLHAAVFFPSIKPLQYVESDTTLLKNETDHLSLLAFKAGITHDPNQVLISWNNSLHFCKWFGVTCSSRHPQRVTVLNFQGQSLMGSLSPHIGNLSFLRNITLNNNSFQGQIPQEIGHLFRLQFLSLISNSFTGEIPKNLTFCSNLIMIDFGKNKLVGKIPLELGSLTKLWGLALDQNNLIGYIPPSFGNLSLLHYLYLSENRLDGSIPYDLGRLKNLIALNVGLNQLTGMVPSSVYNLSSLLLLMVGDNHLHGGLPPDLGLTLPNIVRLYVGGNYFTGEIPRSLVNASGLELLSFSWCNFSGSMPSSLGRLSSLNRLQIQRNKLGGGKDDLGFITALANCSNLQYLDLGGNRFKGILPASVANLSNQLLLLRLDGNQISGAIPSGISNLASLSLLGLHRNHFIGTIPTDLGKLQSLQVIYLHGNKLSGQIPDSLGNLTRLFQLYLQENALQGTIPLKLGNCQHLQELNLSGNNLSGVIPKQVLSIYSLRMVYAGINSFTGSLPSEVGVLENLEILDVSKNRLSGEIPVTLGSCIKLNYLHMEGNSFHGSIPFSFSGLKGIQELDLSSNNLSGQIPKYLEKLHFLQHLNLSFNNFEGEVPKLGIFQNASVFSVVGNIKICGGIPKLNLPACPKNHSKRQGKGLSQRAIISIVVPTVFCTFLLLCFFASRQWLKMPRKKPSSESFTGEHFFEVTYAELLKATDGFSLANLMGVGSYGSVYKGVINCIQKTVAIKVLKLQQRRASKSFVAECKALRSIQHRNIVKILTVCSSIDFSGNDFKALIFEYMPNGSLDMWLHPDPNEHHQLDNLNLIQRINIAIDVACALEYLHHNCHELVVHCDLKPSNVLLDNDMVAHVSDFGLARIISEDVINHSKTQSSSLLIKGSIGYVAPEYGVSGEISTQGDVYSYGIVLLEMLTGKRPTDDMFTDNRSLHQFAEMMLPEGVTDIIDQQLLSEEVQNIRQGENFDKMMSIMHECLVSLVRLGVRCSEISPKDRMEMKDVVRELLGVRDLYHGVGKYRAIQNQIPLSAEGPSHLSNY